MGRKKSRWGLGGNGWGEGAAGDERARVRGWLRTVGCKGVGGNGWGEGAAGDERAWMRGRLRVEMSGEKEPLSELGCADECGRRGCKGVGGNGWGEAATGAWG
eukprot:s579_g5.t1